MITKKFLLPLLAFMLAIVGMGQVSAASPAAIDPSFNIGLPAGFDQTVDALTVQSDGKILLGGWFTSYKGAIAQYITRLNVDGTKDSSFDIGAGFNGGISAIAVQSDNKILAGGNFTTYKGVTTNRIIRLNVDGTRDVSFDMGVGFDNNSYGTIKTITIQNDGKILIGGGFTTYKGVSANKIIRLNSDGTRDASFLLGSGFYTTDEVVSVKTITVQSDGKILVGGNFTGYNLVAAKYIIRLNPDGSRDNTFDMGTGFNDYNVFDIKLQSDGKIVVGGQFTTYQGVAARNIIRLNSDGSRDNTFAIGTAFNAAVYSLIIQSDGKIIAGGPYTYYQGSPVNYIIRLNTNGSKDTSFTMGAGFAGGVSVIAAQSTKIIIGGGFWSYDGLGASKIIRLNVDGTKDASFDIGAGFNRGVSSLVVQEDGKTIIGGSFTSYAGLATNYIARLTITGARDSSFTIGLGFNNSVYSMAIQNDGKILVGGYFTLYNGVSAQNIIRLNTDGTKDVSFIPANFDNSKAIYAIAVQSDGKILLGGSFGQYNGISANKIVRLNPDGSRDSSFVMGVGFDQYQVYSIKIQSDGKILVGGDFTTYQGVTAARVARLNPDGSRDMGFITGINFSSTVYATDIQADGKILIAAGTVIKRFNTDGTQDTGFNVLGGSFDNTIYSLSTQSDGKIFVGGVFSTYNGLTAPRFIRLNADGSKDVGFDLGLGFNTNGTVKSIVMQSGGKIFVGGDFTTYQGMPAGYTISLYGASDTVVLPNSTNTTTINTEFTTKGYTQSNGDLLGSTAISLSDTNGSIPSALSLKNADIKLALPANIQFKKSDNTTNYSGIISVPMIKSTTSVNDAEVISAFKVGSSTESIRLAGGLATLTVPVPTETIGSTVQIYYSEDNGVSWYPQIMTTVIDISGVSYVSFTTNHFTDFAITNFAGSFTINNDAASTTGTSVTLNISTSPTAAKMRFSNDGTTRPSRENYATTKVRTLPGVYGVKTIYAQFDADGDGTSDVTTSDYITYTNLLGNICADGGTCGDLTLQVLSGNSYCQYGTTLNFGTTGSSYAARSLSTGFVASGGSTAWFCEDKQGLGTRALTIQSSAIVNTTTNVSAHTIPATSVSIKNPNAYIAQGACTYSSGASQNQRIAIDSAKSILGKIGTVGEGCKITTDNVSLKVDLVANQAIGQYSGTLTITVPNF